MEAEQAEAEAEMQAAFAGDDADAIPSDFASRAAELAAAEESMSSPSSTSVAAAAAAAAAQEYSSSVPEWSSSAPDVSALLAGTRRMLRL